MMTALKASFTCGKMRVGASHTTKQAGNLPDNEVFSRPKFAHAAPCCIHGFGAGSAYPRGLRHNLFCVDIPSSTRRSIQVASGFQVQQGTEAMTATRKTLVLPQHTHARLQSEQADLIQLHAQAIDGLNAALTHLTTPSDAPQVVILSRALSRTIRASTVLKRACSALNEEVAA